jgi:predicted nucleic acid-binding protein
MLLDFSFIYLFIYAIERKKENARAPLELWLGLENLPVETISAAAYMRIRREEDNTQAIDKWFDRLIGKETDDQMA